MPRRDTDPFANFNFILEIDSVARAGFAECTGLNAESNVIEYREGDDARITPHKQPGLSKYANVVLKHGIAGDSDVYDWWKKVDDGDIERSNCSIVLKNEKQEESKRWNLLEAWPCKWTGPDLKANANEIAFEAIELCHEGVQLQ